MTRLGDSSSQLPYRRNALLAGKLEKATQLIFLVSTKASKRRHCFEAFNHKCKCGQLSEVNSEVTQEVLLASVEAFNHKCKCGQLSEVNSEVTQEVLLASVNSKPTLKTVTGLHLLGSEECLRNLLKNR